MQRMRPVAQHFQLFDPLDQRFGRIGQYQTCAVLQCIIQNAHNIFVNKWFAASKRKLFDTECQRFVDVRFGIVKSHQLQAVIAGFGAFQTKRAGQIAGSAGMKPQFVECMGIDKTARFTGCGVRPLRRTPRCFGC